MTNSPTDLHARLLAAVNARRELAQAATVIGGKHWHFEPTEPDAADDQQGLIVDDAGWTIAAGYMNPDARALVLDNDPAQILRDTAHHLEILAEHQPELLISGNHGPVCHRCRDWEGYRLLMPCSEMFRLAGIYPEENE